MEHLTAREVGLVSLVPQRWACGQPLAVRLDEAALGHGGAVVVPEKERKAFGETYRPLQRAFTLVVNVDVRLAAAPRVATPADDLAFPHPQSFLHLEAALL